MKYIESVCPLCNTPKKKMSRKEFNDILKGMGKKWNELSEAAKGVLKLSEYSFTCNCAEHRGYDLGLKRREIKEKLEKE